MARGPSKKPSAVRKLEGTLTKSKGAGSKGRGRKRDVAVAVSDGLPGDLGVGPLEAPEWLSGYAREAWSALAPRLVANGLLTAVDVEQFAALCMWIGIRRYALEALHGKSSEKGRLLARPKMEVKGHRGSVRNPNLVSLKEATDAVTAIGQRFGLSPADRARLGSGPVSGDGAAGGNELEAWNRKTAEERRARIKAANTK